MKVQGLFFALFSLSMEYFFLSVGDNCYYFKIIHYYYFSFQKYFFRFMFFGTIFDEKFTRNSQVHVVVLVAILSFEELDQTEGKCILNVHPFP